MNWYEDIIADTDHTDARLVDHETGLAAYVVQDLDPQTPDEWAEGEDWSDAWQTLERGEVYGVIITGPDQCHVDSLWGIYDSEYGSWETSSYTYQTAQEMLTSSSTQYRQSSGWVVI